MVWCMAICATGGVTRDLYLIIPDKVDGTSFSFM